MPKCLLCSNTQLDPDDKAPMQSLRSLIESRPAKPPFAGSGPIVHRSCFLQGGTNVKNLIQAVVDGETEAKKPKPEEAKPDGSTEILSLNDVMPATG